MIMKLVWHSVINKTIFGDHLFPNQVLKLSGWLSCLETLLVTSLNIPNSTITVFMGKPMQQKRNANVRPNTNEAYTWAIYNLRWVSDPPFCRPVENGFFMLFEASKISFHWICNSWTKMAQGHCDLWACRDVDILQVCPVAHAGRPI